MSFHKTATFFLVVFISVMAFVTYTALGKKSGNTGMDMGKIHLLRAAKK